MTPFTSDSNDRENDVWDKVFLNLEDYGKIFALGRFGVPNVYGPILFRFKPNALYEASDIAICLRSAGAKGFKREQESLKSIEEVDRIFFYPINDPQGRTAALKFKPKLQESFGEQAQSVEVSCTIEKGILSFYYLEDIVVDPYVLGNAQLPYIVSGIAQEVGLSVQVRKRAPKVGVQPYQDLLQGARPNQPKPTALARDASSAFLRNWAREVESRGRLLLYNYYRYLDYLYHGTVLPVQKRVRSETHVKQPVPTIQFAEGFPAEDIAYDLLAEEFKLIIEDLDSDQADWARSSEEGWLYSD